MITADSSSTPQLPEVWHSGFLNGGLGLGESGRLVSAALTAAGVPLEGKAWDRPFYSTVPFTGGNAAEGPSQHGGLSLLSFNGEHLHSFVRHGGKRYFEGRYVIGIWFCELEALAPEVTAGFRLVDEVWAATPFMQEAMLRSAGSVPVRLFDHPMRIPAGDRAMALQRFPFENRFVFLTTFDYQSHARRKNPHAACEAFATAFPEPVPGGPLCLIKTINHAMLPVDHAVLRWRWAHRPDIVFMEDFLTAADRDLLVWRADACVSLHRAEGLGLTLMESMAVGTPCIATQYSGNLAFMSEDDSWLIPWTRVPVGPGLPHSSPELTWAEADCAAAAAAMQEILAGGESVRNRARRGQERVRQRHSLETTGRHMASLLAAAATRSPRPKEKADLVASYRAKAYQTLAALKIQTQTLAQLPRQPLWRAGHGQEASNKETAKLAVLQRRALSLTLQSLKQHDQAQQERLQSMQARLELLSAQLAELVPLLPNPR